MRVIITLKNSIKFNLPKITKGLIFHLIKVVTLTDKRNPFINDVSQTSRSLRKNEGSK